MKELDALTFKEETDMAGTGQDPNDYQGSNQPLEADVDGAYEAQPEGASNPPGYEVECEPISRLAPCEEASPLEADADVCDGSLRVIAYSNCDDAGDDYTHTGFYDEDPEDNYLQGVEVAIQAGGFNDSGYTNEGGIIDWNNLPPGPYQVTAFVPTGYDPAPGYGVDSNAMGVGGTGGTGAAPAMEYKYQKGGRPSVTCIVKEGEERVIFRFVPRPAVLIVNTYLDARRCGIATGQQPINGVTFEVYRGQTRIGSYKTGDATKQGVLLPCPGEYSVSASPSIKIQGRAFSLSHSRPIGIDAEPDGYISLDFGYVAESSAVQVSACVEWEQDGKTQKSFLNDVSFKLFKGMSTSCDPVREGKTSGPVPVTFHNLPGGTYTLAVDGPRSRIFKGQMIDLHDPRGGVSTFVLNSGQSQPLSKEFCFKPCEGRIGGRITYEQSCEPVPNAPVLVFAADGKGKHKTVFTDVNGRWELAGMKPGEYIVAAQHFTLDGKQLVPSETTLKEQRIRVRGSALVEADDITVVEDEHRIYGYVTDTDGNAVTAAVIEIRDTQDRIVGTTTTKEDPPGYYEYTVEIPGEYFVVLRETASGSPAQRFSVHVNPPAQRDFTIAGSAARGNTGAIFGGGQNFQNAFQTAFAPISDLASFPVLTEEVNFPSSPRPSWPGNSGSAPIGVMIEGALREVLGWKPRNDDPKGFVGALTQSFTCTDVEGHTECKWVPRTYAVQTDLSGGVTGAQASVYKRAQDAVDQSMSVLDGLYPLRSDADPQDIDALRAVVKNQMTEIVRELGIPGGPRVTRVDQLFTLLLGPQPVNAPDPDDVEGQLGILRREFGLRSRPSATEQGNLINTVEEEQNLTNFRILSDYMTSLRQSWINNRQFFVRPAQQPFYGTQLVLLSRGLNVVAESVEEVRFTMDSVMIGPAERQTLEIRFPATVPLPPHAPTPPVFNSQGLLVQQPDPINDPLVNGQPMFVEELLTWVSSFSTEEGPRLIQDGGKFAVNNTFLPVVCQLRNLVLGAIGPVNLNSLPRGYRTPRVQRALQELALQLDELAILANPIQHQIPSQV
jgi:hypothetical protein